MNDVYKELTPEILDQVSKEIDEASFEDQITIGSNLWELRKKIDLLTNKIKESMRQKALEDFQKANGEKKTFTYNGEKSQVRVSVPSDTISLIQGTDIQKLSDKLGMRFSQLFEVKTVVEPRKDFVRTASSLSKKQQDVVFEVIQQKPNTLRVSFKSFK